MNRSKLLAVVMAGGFVAACDSGDINIAPSTTVTDSNNTTIEGGGDDPNAACASYIRAGQEISGTADGSGNCTYGSAFVGPKNNLTEDLFIPALPNNGAHIFTSSLFVGETYRTQAELTAAGITEGGDGPTLTIEAGATLAFQTNKDFVIINRGSRILADGRPDAPITFTSTTDVNGTVSPEDVQEWGGMVINGFGVSNKCLYDGVRGEAGFTLRPGTECSIEAEGSAGDDESQYGGDNDDDDSGILRYVVVKHTGAEVGNGDELNGISFGGVGRSTVVENLQVYSTYDDGIEMFGGSVNFTNFVAVYVRDDSIDIDEGYNGTITNALVIQQADNGNHCIEADGIGDYSNVEPGDRPDFITFNLNSAPTINSLTCIISASFPGTHGPGAGFLFREGIHPVVNNSIVVSTYAANDTDGAPGAAPADAADDNYGLWIRQIETQDAATNGDLQLNGVIFAVQEPQEISDSADYDEEAFVAGVNAQFSADAIAADGAALDPTTGNLVLLEGELGIYSVALASAVVDGVAPTVTAVDPDGDGDAEAPTFLGGVSAADDWTAGWTYGIHPDNRGQALPWE